MAPRMTLDDRAGATDRAVNMYGTGESVRAIASTLGRSYGWVHRALKSKDVKMRARGGKTR